MSNDSSKLGSDVVVKLNQELSVLKRKDKFNEYCINHLKAEIRLLRDTLNKIQGSSKECLDYHEEMNETLEIKIEKGIHLNHNGEEIKYFGESDPSFGKELKRKR